MVGIKVRPSASHDQPRRQTVISQVSGVYHKTKSCWNQFQIGHRECYSIERMLALRDYYEQTSLLRVILVCLLTPLPAFTVAILIECIPLASPSDGWRANYAFYIRLFLSSFPMAIGGVLQVKQVIPPGIISTKATIGIGIGTASGYVVCALSLAAWWEFPVPFGYVVMVGPFVFFFMMSFGLAIRLFAMNSALRQQIIPQLSVLATQGLLAGCYPPYFAAFRQLSGLQQTAFVLVMPFIKTLNKQYTARRCAHLQEYIGPMIIFSVDVCNVLYTVICMQTAVSSLTTLFMVISDIFFIIIAIHSVYYPNNRSLLKDKNYLQTLPGMMLQVYRSVDSFEDPIRVCAPFSLPLFGDSKQLISELCNESKNAAPSTTASYSISSVVPVAFRRQSSLSDIRYFARNLKDDADLTPAFVSSKRRASITSVPMSRPPNVEVSRRCVSLVAATSERVLSPIFDRHLRSKNAVQEIQDALRVLFHSEYIMLSEYVECVLPVLYATYLAILHHLPTAEYYPHMRSVTTDKLIVILENMALYGLVELASFIGVGLLLKRKLGFSPLYQVAFVLETQAQTLQSLLFVWVLCVLQFTLVHNGVDLDAPFK